MKKAKDKMITIGWLYPELMSTYGDRGNIIILQKRCEWRGISARVKPIDFKSTVEDVGECSLIIGGGAQDRQQGIVIDDLLKHKKEILTKLISSGTPGLFVCGSPQLLGHYYMTGEGTKLEGLGIFDMVSKHFGPHTPRLIGNTISIIGDEYTVSGLEYRNTVVGFENHGGRTYLGNGLKPFARVVYGNGNNGEDKTEGAVFNNCIATYSHGPFLTKNPHIADWLIAKALEIIGCSDVKLDAINDTNSWLAHEAILKRFGAKN
jgi:lipid II isoglutaminyl synthase (glutamine-hydrolysing)